MCCSRLFRERQDFDMRDSVSGVTSRAIARARPTNALIDVERRLKVQPLRGGFERWVIPSGAGRFHGRWVRRSHLHDGHFSSQIKGISFSRFRSVTPVSVPMRFVRNRSQQNGIRFARQKVHSGQEFFPSDCGLRRIDTPWAVAYDSIGTKFLEVARQGVRG